jgi:hypothetical protein
VFTRRISHANRLKACESKGGCAPKIVKAERSKRSTVERGTGEVRESDPTRSWGERPATQAQVATISTGGWLQISACSHQFTKPAQRADQAAFAHICMSSAPARLAPASVCQAHLHVRRTAGQYPGPLAADPAVEVHQDLRRCTYAYRVHRHTHTQPLSSPRTQPLRSTRTCGGAHTHIVYTDTHTPSR